MEIKKVLEGISQCHMCAFSFCFLGNCLGFSKHKFFTCKVMRLLQKDEPTFYFSLPRKKEKIYCDRLSSMFNTACLTNFIRELKPPKP